MKFCPHNRPEIIMKKGASANGVMGFSVIESSSMQFFALENPVSLLKH